MVFSRQEQWSGLPCPPPGDLPDPHSGTCEAAQIRGGSYVFSFCNLWLCTIKRLLVLGGSLQYWNVAAMSCDRCQDSWPLEERNSIQGQWWGLIAQSFLYIKFYIYKVYIYIYIKLFIYKVINKVLLKYKGDRESFWCMSGATMRDPNHDKRHVERTWQTKAKQDSRDSLDLLQHLPQN